MVVRFYDYLCGLTPRLVFNYKNYLSCVDSPVWSNRYILALSIFVASVAAVRADEPAVSAADMAALPSVADTLLTDSTATIRKSFINKVIDYFANSNRENTGRKFDMSIIGGPHYSSDTKFGIGIVAAGFYRSSRTDTISQPSNVSLYGDVCTSGFYMLGVRGTHIFFHDRSRIDYDLSFYSFPRYFWGIGYDCGIDMANKSKYKEMFVNASVDYLWRAWPHFYLGPSIQFGYVNARHRANPELWLGQRSHVATYGVGIGVQFDTRDNLTAPTRGVHVQFDQRACPRFLKNDYAFSYTELTAAVYNPLWRDAVFAAEFHTRLSYGDVPWDMLSTFGGSHTMRGYYEGRFRDKGEMDLTVELRQHIWHRNGIVVWAGAGSVFPRLSAMRLRRILPNYGIGYRWEFKKLTNVRLDFGLGKGENSFIFSINEAF